MAVSMDPEGREVEALFPISGEFTEKSVLEIGCGYGRLTWLIADRAGHVVGIDPNEEKIARAQQNTPASLLPRVEFHAVGLEDYEILHPPGKRFDRAVLSWSL